MSIKEGNTDSEEELKAERIKKVKEKLGKKDLRAKEVGELWGYVINGENQDAINEKTIRNYINKICSMGKGLEREDFFFTDSKSKNKKEIYILKPKVQRLFFCLLDSGLLSDNHKHSVSYRNKLDKKLMSSIENWLSEEEQDAIKKTEAYLNAINEREIIKKYFESWYSLNKILFSSESRMRYKKIAIAIQFIDKLKDTYNRTISQEKIKITTAKKINPYINLDSQVGKNIEDIIVSMIADELKKSLDENEDELLNVLLRLSGWESVGDSEDKKHLNLKYAERYTQIENNLNIIFNKNDEWEKKIADIFLDMLHVISLITDESDLDFGEISAVKRARKIEDTYIEFFSNYEEVSEALKLSRTESYKKYLKLKDDERFKKFLESIDNKNSD